ncbi:hypothetical protein EU537_13245 [Candidatus Thorarchaeota archaeon]|nr:MAG: hypothetical protein EU537_13245 [Candidatus Thorarchaeota archaeon]
MKRIRVPGEITETMLVIWFQLAITELESTPDYLGRRDEKQSANLLLGQCSTETSNREIHTSRSGSRNNH